MVNKGDENITSSLFIRGTNKPSKETEWKFLIYLWNNMRTQENTNQVKSSTQHTPHPHFCKRSNINSHNPVLDLGLNVSSEAIPEFVIKCIKLRQCI